MSATRRSTAAILIALAAAVLFAVPSTAEAHHARHKHVAKAKLLPAHEKPGYAAKARAALLFPIDIGLNPGLPLINGLVLK